MTGRGMRRRLLFPIVMAALVVLVAGGIGEVGLRVLRPKLDLAAMTGRAVGGNPMASWAVLDAFCAYRGRAGAHGPGKTVNGDGFISTPEVARAKEPGVLRVAFFGESSTAGTGHDLPDESTWPWIAAAALRTELSRPVDFLNAALGGYTTFESYGRLWSRVRFYHPDVLVVDHGWNEMYYMTDARQAATWRTLPDGSWSFEKTPRPVVFFEPLPVDRFLGWSQLLIRLRIRLLGKLHGEGVGAPKDGRLGATFDRAGLEVFRTNLRLMRETARLLQAELFVVKQPTLIVKDLAPAEQERCAYHLHGFDHAAHVDAFAAIYRVIDDEIPPENVIDATVMSGRPELFHDHVHPTPEGARQLGELVARAVAARRRGGSTGP